MSGISSAPISSTSISGNAGQIVSAVLAFSESESSSLISSLIRSGNFSFTEHETSTIVASVLKRGSLSFTEHETISISVTGEFTGVLSFVEIESSSVAGRVLKIGSLSSTEHETSSTITSVIRPISFGNHEVESSTLEVQLLNSGSITFVETESNNVVGSVIRSGLLSFSETELSSITSVEIQILAFSEVESEAEFLVGSITRPGNLNFTEVESTSIVGYFEQLAHLNFIETETNSINATVERNNSLSLTEEELFLIDNDKNRYGTLNFTEAETFAITGKLNLSGVLNFVEAETSAMSRTSTWSGNLDFTEEELTSIDASRIVTGSLDFNEIEDTKFFLKLRNQFSPVGNAFQWRTDDGQLIPGGKLHTYYARTSTPAPTYTVYYTSDYNTNPIILDSGSRTPFPIWLAEGEKYKFVLTDANNVIIRDYDDIYGSKRLVRNVVRFEEHEEMTIEGTVEQIPEDCDYKSFGANFQGNEVGPLIGNLTSLYCIHGEDGTLIGNPPWLSNEYSDNLSIGIDDNQVIFGGNERLLIGPGDTGSAWVNAIPSDTVELNFNLQFNLSSYNLSKPVFVLDMGFGAMETGSSNYLDIINSYFVKIRITPTERRVYLPISGQTYDIPSNFWDDGGNYLQMRIESGRITVSLDGDVVIISDNVDYVAPTGGIGIYMYDSLPVSDSYLHFESIYFNCDFYPS